MMNVTLKAQALFWMAYQDRKGDFSPRCYFKLPINMGYFHFGAWFHHHAWSCLGCMHGEKWVHLESKVHHCCSHDEHKHGGKHGRFRRTGDFYLQRKIEWPGKNHCNFHSSIDLHLWNIPVSIWLNLLRVFAGIQHFPPYDWGRHQRRGIDGIAWWSWWCGYSRAHWKCCPGSVKDKGLYIFFLYFYPYTLEMNSTHIEVSTWYK